MPCSNGRTAHLEGFVQNIGHLVLKILRCSEGAREQEAARTASVYTNPEWNGIGTLKHSLAVWKHALSTCSSNVRVLIKTWKGETSAMQVLVQIGNLHFHNS